MQHFLPSMQQAQGIEGGDARNVQVPELVDEGMTWRLEEWQLFGGPGHGPYRAATSPTTRGTSLFAEPVEHLHRTFHYHCRQSG